MALRRGDTLQAQAARQREMLLLRQHGLTYAEIGKRVGISREGVWRALRTLERAGVTPRMPWWERLAWEMGASR